MKALLAPLGILFFVFGLAAAVEVILEALGGALERVGMMRTQANAPSEGASKLGTGFGHDQPRYSRQSRRECPPSLGS